MWRWGVVYNTLMAERCVAKTWPLSKKASWAGFCLFIGIKSFSWSNSELETRDREHTPTMIKARSRFSRRGRRVVRPFGGVLMMFSMLDLKRALQRHAIWHTKSLLSRPPPVLQHRLPASLSGGRPKSENKKRPAERPCKTRHTFMYNTVPTHVLFARSLSHESPHRPARWVVTHTKATPTSRSCPHGSHCHPQTSPTNFLGLSDIHAATPPQ